MIGRRRVPGAHTYTKVLPAADRYVSDQEGIRSWHAFSAGEHYDPDNVAFGALVGVDEHAVDAAAGFSRHAHRGVAVVTWVVEGTLRHEDSTGAQAVVRPGQVAVQIAGRGVEHSEVNASADEPLRFVQTTFVCDDDEPRYYVGEPPAVVPGALFAVHRDGPLILEAGRVHLHVVRGEFVLNKIGLEAGDSMRMTPDPRILLTEETSKLVGSGEVLVIVLR